jgi:osmoprotectant transport system permease protein
LHNISDLRRYPDLVFGLTNEFMDRRDGWPSLRDRYGLSPVDVRGMDHDLAYRGIASGDVHVTDVYSTDADIAYYGLRLLADDRHAFPEYLAMVVYRNDFAEKCPSWKSVIRSLEYGINDSVMRRMNGEVKLHGKTESETAANFLRTQGFSTQSSDAPHLMERMWIRTAEHLVLVGLSLIAAIVIAIPVGIWGARNKRLGDTIVSATGMIQVVPNLALLVMLIPVLGIGFKPAVVALFLYSLLPIVRNTQTGIQTIDAGVRESAVALGLPRHTILKWIELPIALPQIIAGIKTSAVINIGTATLGALIGAGGYGQPILTGIRLDNVGLILEGAVPAALMALLAQGLLGQLEKAVVRRRTKA